MATGSSLVGGTDEISKGLFGYRKADVAQLLSDRDHMLRQAESRIRTAEARIGELEAALDQSQSQKAAMLEQLQQHQRQLESLNAQRAQVEQYAAQVQAHAEKLAEWQKQVQGKVGAMAPTVDRLLQLVDGAPSRVQTALAPVATKMPALVNLMRELVQRNQPRQALANR